MAFPSMVPPQYVSTRGLAGIEPTTFWIAVQMYNHNIRLIDLSDAWSSHLSSRMALDGLLDFAVRSSPQGLQQLVAML